MIELAPDHKTGLPTTNPILLGAGAIGCGDAVPPGLAPRTLGAAVVGPVLRFARSGPKPPRVAEFNGGLVLDAGLQNRGIRSVLAKCAPTWPKLGCPVVVQVADREANDLAYVVNRLEPVPSVSGIELLVHPETDENEIGKVVSSVAMNSELPVWVKLPLTRAVDLANAARTGGAHALVIGQAPQGALLRSDTGNTPVVEGQIRALTVRGSVFGPAMFPIALAALLDVASLNLGLPLILCGGIHTWGQVKQALSAGASAVQVDSAVWIEPGVPERLVRSWAENAHANRIR